MLLLIISSGTYAADCSKIKISYESQICLTHEIKSLKKELATILNHALEQTEAKAEFKASQKKWLAYKESQCGDFVVADAQGSPATVEYDLYCQTILYKQRITLIKKLFN